MNTRRALVCAHRMPEFDREGGSRRIFHFLEFLQQDGWVVSFAAENGIGGERYVQTLQQMGIATYTLHNPWAGGEDARIDFEQLVGTGQFELVLFAFWTSAESHMARARQLSPDSLVVVDSIDLHLLRQSRRVFCEPGTNGDAPKLDQTYADEARRELNVYAAADAVLTVSEKESGLINDFVGRTIAHTIPDTEEVLESSVPLADRKGMLFVGNFRHPPNVHAVEYLCQQVVPRIPPEVLRRHPIYIVGNAPAQAVIDCCSRLDNVRLVGWVPSILPYLERARLSLVPLLYGAGTKRKLMQSLMVGTPSVSTSIGIEGLNLEHNRQVLVADDAALFVASITRLVNDDELWTRLAHDGREFIRAIHGPDEVSKRFSAVIAQIASGEIGASVFCEELEQGTTSEFDSGLDEAVRQYVLRQRRFRGYCNIEGAETEFDVASDNLRESLVSSVSGSINRHRQLVCTLSMALFGHPRATFRAICDHINRRRLRVFIAETNSVLPQFLARSLDPDLLITSEYFGPDHRSGESVNGVLHQDLQQTSFADQEFDIVITSEVFEHIPDALAAEREVMRILKPGGVYCFTVPFMPEAEHDMVLAGTNEDGSIEYFTEPQFHDDPIRPEGILVYRIFSFNDMKTRFEALGHRFVSHRFWSEPLGILGNDCWAHTVRKGGEAPAAVEGRA